MSEATNKVAALRAELAKAEADEKAERAAARAAEKAARQAKLEADTDEYRQNEYAGFAGPHDSYVAISSYGSGGIELSLNEYTSFAGSVALTCDEALELVAEIQKALR